jgi:hypothetical protein
MRYLAPDVAIIDQARPNPEPAFVMNLHGTIAIGAYLEPAVWAAPAPQADSFVALQRWEGRVIECGADTFRAILTDLTDPGPEEEVELLLADVPPEDRPLVGAGAIFYWSIGYRNEASGGKPRMSTLRFRRLPVWTETELAAAREPVGPLAEFFGAD